MTDLSNFGVDVSEPEPEEPEADQAAEAPDREYRNGRCPAINVGDRKRCRSPVSRMRAADGLCGVHGRERDPWTIHDDAETLIGLTGRLDALSLDEVDPSEVDFDLERIRAAVSAVQEAST